MKFKDPNSKQVYDTLFDAFVAFCRSRTWCRTHFDDHDKLRTECPFHKMGLDGARDCYLAAEKNPRDSAKMMGYEIIEEEGAAEPK